MSDTFAGFPMDLVNVLSLNIQGAYENTEYCWIQNTTLRPALSIDPLLWQWTAGNSALTVAFQPVSPILH